MVDVDSIMANPLSIFAGAGNPYYWVIGIMVFIFLLGFGYFFVFKKHRLKYHVQIYERENSGIPIPTDTDILEEQMLNKGKNTMYFLKKNKAEAHPPISKFIYKRKKGLFRAELWCDYVRERHEWIPVSRQIELGLSSKMDIVEYGKRLLEIYETKPEEARQKFIYSPLIPTALPKLKFEPMDYNLNEMLQTKIAHREQLYADKQGWMQTYGPMLGIGLAAVALIVIAYMGFNFAASNINGVINAANAVAEKLGTIAESCMVQPPTPPLA